MLDRDEERPSFGLGEASKIAYDLFGVEGALEELPSERDRNFRITTDTGESFVLKISATSEDRSAIEFQNEAMMHISEKGIVTCPVPIASKSDEFISIVPDSKGESHFVRLLSYLSGRLLARTNPHSPELLRDLGRFMGRVSGCLADFTHPGSHRELYWDMKNAASVIHKYKDLIVEKERQDVIDHFLTAFETEVLPCLPSLRHSVIHSDGNDYNIIIDNAYSESERSFGLLDFGDMVHSCTIFEIAVAATYAIMGKSDPLTAAALVISGYHSQFPLTEEELNILFLLICGRLITSVCVSAHQKSLEPENDYLVVSERLAWAALDMLKGVHPRFASYLFREACGLVPCPRSAEVENWLLENQAQIGPLVEFNLRSAPHAVIDLSIGSRDISNPDVFSSAQSFAQVIDEFKRVSGSDYLIGRYNEARLMYQSGLYSVTSDLGPESRTIHTALDLFLEPETGILAPLDGVVHSLGNNPGPFDNGPTVILEHEIGESGLRFYTLYAHLSEASLAELSPKQRIRKGERIATVGTPPSNGGWPPHLHFQIIADIFDWKDDFPGVARPSHRRTWLSVCPNPNLILMLPEDELRDTRLSKSEILQLRKSLFCSNLSISYREPLQIVRGYKQYLYDEEGRQYLDARNNVPHIGHSHPAVVRAIAEQAAVLNTNTRYLHESLVQYAQYLCSTLPEPLRVCFFVNSGSEANELALRLARTHTRRKDIIVIDNAYHGNTGTLVDISPYKHNGPGGKGPPPFVHAVRMPDPYRGAYRNSDEDAGEKYARDLEVVIEKLERDGRAPAAFIFESLMGCGGQIVFPDGYLQNAFTHVQRAGGVCIADEVQVGFGRVGTHFWGFETQGVVPDIVTMGKPIGNGHPLAAVVTTAEIAESFANGMEFFSTTGGNPVSCAAGLAVLEVIEKHQLQKHALEVGNHLLARLKELSQKHAIIGDVRGLGLFIGVELILDRATLEPATDQAAYVANRMKELGVLLSTDGPFDNVLKIKPPLVFSKENAESLIRVLERVLHEDFVRFATTK
ncbi:MAG: aminotransferase class III-fold pyridoxal phosphate-dependent enzyme [Candidatus Thorarchaeota archaeon]|nr:aminotransferase class III-fold pyridoxal phosphate-dependent enzyme [Candidatus Thorarchaeota archaeon]